MCAIRFVRRKLEWYRLYFNEPQYIKKLLYVSKFDHFYWNIVLCNKNEYKPNN